MEIKRITEKYAAELGEMMVSIYSNLDGFPSPQEQPAYYEMLRNIAALNAQEHTQVLIAVEENCLLGGLVYFSDMSAYGAGGMATQVKYASGIRLLGVKPVARGKGVGKTLTLRCMEMARVHGNRQIVLHTTRAMNTAWAMYEHLGFYRSKDLDFLQEELEVFGFRLDIEFDK